MHNRFILSIDHNRPKHQSLRIELNKDKNKPLHVLLGHIPACMAKLIPLVIRTIEDTDRA